MAKRIKLTKEQVKMLKEHQNKVPKNKTLRITEAQYNRLFANNSLTENKTVNEGPITDFAIENGQFLLDALRTLVNNQSQDGLDRIFRENGLTWGDYFGALTDLGIVTVTYLGSKEIYKISKSALIKNFKKAYNFVFRKNHFDGTPRKNNAQPKEEGAVMLGNDMELSEDNYPPGAGDDPNAPFNQNDGSEPHRASEEFFQLVDEVQDDMYHLLFMKGGDGRLYVTIYSAKTTGFEEYCGGSTPDTDCIIDQLNAMHENNELDDMAMADTGLIDVVDEAMKEYIQTYHCKNPQTAQKIGSIINGMAETTTAGGVGGSYEAPLGGESPIKRQMHEDDLDETTMSGDATGAYEQPQIWAKDKKNWRHGKDTMYPDGKIVE